MECGPGVSGVKPTSPSSLTLTAVPSGSAVRVTTPLLPSFPPVDGTPAALAGATFAPAVSTAALAAARASAAVVAALETALLPATSGKPQLCARAPEANALAKLRTNIITTKSRNAALTSVMRGLRRRALA